MPKKIENLNASEFLGQRNVNQQAAEQELTHQGTEEQRQEWQKQSEKEPAKQEPDRFDDGYDSDADPAFSPGWEARYCKEEVFSSCNRCLKLLCYAHFLTNPDCDSHTKRKQKRKRI